MLCINTFPDINTTTHHWSDNEKELHMGNLTNPLRYITTAAVVGSFACVSAATCGPWY